MSGTVIAPKQPFTKYTNELPNRTSGATYRNTSHLPLMVMLTAYSGGGASYIKVRCDEDSTPSTLVAIDESDVGEWCSVVYVVPPHYYFKIEVANLIKWFELV